MFDEPQTYSKPQPIERAVPTDAPDPLIASQALAIYRYLPPTLLDSEVLVPQHLDYRVAVSQRLYSETRFMHGELTHVNYWGAFAAAGATAASGSGPRATRPARNATTPNNDSGAFSDLIVSERHAYTRDGENYATRRDITISWFRNDGTPHPDTKVRTKFYDRKGQINELKRRRENIVDWLRGVFVGTPLEGAVREVLLTLSPEVIDYIETGSNALREEIGRIERAWLDSPIPTDPRFTFRQYLPVELARGMVTSYVK